MALLFNLAILLFYPVDSHFFNPPRQAASGVSYQQNRHEIALDFFTGYLIEYSLSVDNLFVFIMIFSFFGVNNAQQHKALSWGIAGAIVFRLLFVIIGVTAISLLHQVMYFFGLLLIWSAYKMAFAKEKGVEPDKIALVRWFRKIFPVTKEYVGDRFFIRTHAGLAATPLALVVLVVESSDIMFAIDSIPAIIAITKNTFIVITSNVFAILGLRSLYFVLAKIMGLFRYLKHGVALILTFVGFKMLWAALYKDLYQQEESPLPTWLSLLIIIGILTTSILASKLIKPRRNNPTQN